MASNPNFSSREWSKPLSPSGFSADRLYGNFKSILNKTTAFHQGWRPEHSLSHRNSIVNLPTRTMLKKDGKESINLIGKPMMNSLEALTRNNLLLGT